MLSIISEAALCKGNPDERFLMLLNIHKNTMKDAVGIFCVTNYVIWDGLNSVCYMKSRFNYSKMLPKDYQL